jgi:hypothetical protein
MQNMANPFLGMYQTQIEASRRFLDTIFSSTEKIDQVVRGAAQRAVNEQLNFAEAFTQARDPASIGAAWQSGMAARNSDQAVNYQRELVRIVVEMQSELGKGVQDYVEQMRSQTTSGFKSQADTSVTQPAGDTAFNPNPVTSLFSVWQNAFKEASSLAQRNLSTFNDAVGSAAQQTSRYVNGTAGAARNIAESAESGIASAADAGVSAAAQAGESAAEAFASNAERKHGTAPGGKKK